MRHRQTGPSAHSLESTIVIGRLHFAHSGQSATVAIEISELVKVAVSGSLTPPGSAWRVSFVTLGTSYRCASEKPQVLGITSKPRPVAVKLSIFGKDGVLMKAGDTRGIVAGSRDVDMPHVDAYAMPLLLNGSTSSSAR